MITENLTVGMIFKNYKDLCNFINEQEKGRGNSRTSQFKEWKRFFNWHKNGNKLVIDEIYLEPLEKIDGRKNNGHSEGSRNNNNPYGQYIDLLLKEYMATTKNIDFYATTNILAKKVGLINYNYSYCSRNKNRYFQYSYSEATGDRNKTAMWDTFGIIKGILKGAIRSALNRLAITGLITFDEAYIIVFFNVKRMATEDEEKEIKICENEILLYLDTTKQKMQFDDRLRNKYYKEVEKLVRERVERVSSYFIGYKIHKLVHMKSELSKEKIIELREDVNGLLSGRVKSSLLKVHHKTKEQTKIDNPKWVGSPDPKWERWTRNRINISYFSYSDYIIDSLIKLNFKLIIKDVENTNIVEFIEKGTSLDIEKLSAIDIKEFINNATDDETRDVLEYAYQDRLDKDSIPY